MAKINRAKNTYEREPSWLVFLFASQVHLIRAVWKMAKVQRKQRTCKLRGNMSYTCELLSQLYIKCIYHGSQWSSLVWDLQRKQVIIVLFKAGAILIRYGRRWSMSWAWSTRKRGRGRKDLLVALKVETSKLYRPSEPTSTTLVRTSFVQHDFCLLLVHPVPTLASNKLNHLRVVYEHEYCFGLINFVKVLNLTWWSAT